IAIREDRIRVARDLHDGVLQSLTGIRLQLQALADEHGAPSLISDRLLAVERAIAIEQRELRLFIEDLKPIGSHRSTEADLAGALSLRERVAAAGGRLAIESAPTGSRVEIILPGVARLRVQEIRSSF